jgi:YesN/AraC family two-component response regulator
MSEKSNPKILIVDDESDVEMLFRQYFRKEIRAGSLEFLFAFTAEDAIEQLENGIPPEIIYIFSDINMPGMSGFDLLSIVQQKFLSVKVCMVSAYSTNEYRDKAIELGADFYFTKPIDFPRLKEKINEIMSVN